MLCSKRTFGYMPDGTAVEQYALDNGEIRCAVITYGGALTVLETPDAQGTPVDIALGFDTLEGYLKQDKYMGAIIGRYANRIAGGRFFLHTKEYPLAQNDGKNHLHGGETGFDKRVWQAEEMENGLLLTLFSPHREGGYPGNLHVWVQYLLRGKSLHIKYRAISDEDTIVNLTNHAYFNLGGHSGGGIHDQYLQLYAPYYTPVADAQCIPTGELVPVAHTPMDFMKSTRMGARINEAFEQLLYGAGYDHNWVVDGKAGALRPAAKVYCPSTGIVMEVKTTMPGIQFYTGNHLDGCPPGKGGAAYHKRSAFCLETQFFPNSPNQRGFPQPILRAGGVWEHTTVFSMDVQ
ncbi:galactose mutarotase [Christensenellaceae bacterium OttesenSCG-928-M15]|nr:galactose mutarotase [Christensenellaceae bacterium OttesenSCG-928-M15]